MRHSWKAIAALCFFAVAGCGGGSGGSGSGSSDGGNSPPALPSGPVRLLVGLQDAALYTVYGKSGWNIRVNYQWRGNGYAGSGKSLIFQTDSQGTADVWIAYEAPHIALGFALSIEETPQGFAWSDPDFPWSVYWGNEWIVDAGTTQYVLIRVYDDSLLFLLE